MEITANIINRGEDAFNARFYLQLPKEVNYMSADCDAPGVSMLCSKPEINPNRTLLFDVGNPLPANSQVQ